MVANWNQEVMFFIQSEQNEMFLAGPFIHTKIDHNEPYGLGEDDQIVNC